MDKKTATKPAPGKEKPKATGLLKLSDIQKEIESLKQTVLDHAQQIADLQARALPKRKPTRNGKIQIRDKQTGKVYPSKNNAYQSLLKAGELKELVDKGIFGPEPEKNNFGWFALVRAWPDRFEEVREVKEVEAGAEPEAEVSEVRKEGDAK